MVVVHQSGSRPFNDRSVAQIMNGVASRADTGPLVALVCRSILGRTCPAQVRVLSHACSR